MRLQIEQLRYHSDCIDPLDDTRDARWISLISITMNACYFGSQNPVATWSMALSRCDVSLKTMTTSGMRAHAGVQQKSTTGQQKKKGSRVQAENKDHRDTKNASRRGRNNTASRRGQKEGNLFHFTGYWVPLNRLASVGHLPNTEIGKTFQLARNSLDILQPKDKHC